MITILGLILGVLGLIATIIGAYFSYISFVNPLVRFKRYLKKAKNWEKFQGIEVHLTVFRHKKYPNFQIVIDWDYKVVENFREEWINDNLFPDKKNNASYFVKLEANGMLLDKEIFVSLDGHRYFVPVPRTSLSNGDLNYFYDIKQIQLANIIGKYHFGDMDIYSFAANQSKTITMMDML
jgi:hypothetical protein